FSNTTLTRASTNGTLQTAAPVGTWYYALLVAPQTQNTIATNRDPTLQGWTFAATGTNKSLAGRLDGNNDPNYPIACYVPGYAPPASADFAVVGWSSNIGRTWAEAQAWWHDGSPSTGPHSDVAGWFGISGVAQDVPLAPVGGVYWSVFTWNPVHIQGINLSYYAAAPPAPMIQNITHNNGSLSFGWSAIAGRTYQVQYATNLAQPVWINLG